MDYSHQRNSGDDYHHRPDTYTHSSYRHDDGYGSRRGYDHSNDSNYHPQRSRGEGGESGNYRENSYRDRRDYHREGEGRYFRGDRSGEGDRYNERGRDYGRREDRYRDSERDRDWEQERSRSRPPPPKPKPDWICAQCGFQNFAKRQECKECRGLFSSDCILVDQGKPSNSGNNPRVSGHNSGLPQDCGGAYAPKDSYAASLSNDAVAKYAAEALRAAQWSSSNGYSKAGGDNYGGQGSIPSAVVKPPKLSKYPPLFEVEGSRYVFLSSSGCFHHQLSEFYYMPKSKLYYSGRTGVYYRYKEPVGKPPLSQLVPFPERYTAAEGKYFQIFGPPLPSVNSATLHNPSSTANVSDTKTGTSESTSGDGKTGSTVTTKKNFSMSLGVKKVTRPKIESRRVLSDVSVSEEISAAVSSDGSDIALSSRKAENTASPPSTSTDTSTTVTTTNTTTTVTASGAPACLLCRRQFTSPEQLERHIKESKLHAENVRKQEEQQQISSIDQDSEIAASFHRVAGGVKKRRVPGN